MNINRIAEAAAIMGEPARAAMLVELMAGRALTAGELARVANVTPPTASGHLARMTEAGVLAVEKQGRHRYYRLASAAVAQMVEGFMQFAAADTGGRRIVTGPGDQALRAARTCYDHIAGRLGVAIADRLVEDDAVVMEDGVGQLTEAGRRWLDRAGVGDVLDRDALLRSRRPLCRTCLDWSERRPHLAGKVGTAILTHALEQDWVRRGRDRRPLTVTPGGRIALRDRFGIRWDG